MLWLVFITVFKEKIAERLSWLLTRLVKDHRSRVKWLERKWLPMFGKKKCVVWCVRGLLVNFKWHGGKTEVIP